MSTPDSDADSNPTDAQPHPMVQKTIKRNRERANAPNPITEATRKRRVNPLTDPTP
jgi:hypothetical protein